MHCSVNVRASILTPEPALCTTTVVTSTYSKGNAISIRACTQVAPSPPGVRNWGSFGEGSASLWNRYWSSRNIRPGEYFVRITGNLLSRKMLRRKIKHINVCVCLCKGRRGETLFPHPHTHRDSIASVQYDDFSEHT